MVSGGARPKPRPTLRAGVAWRGTKLGKAWPLASWPSLAHCHAISVLDSVLLVPLFSPGEDRTGPVHLAGSQKASPKRMAGLSPPTRLHGQHWPRILTLDLFRCEHPR